MLLVVLVVRVGQLLLHMVVEVVDKMWALTVVILAMEALVFA
jgi:hypothetical protein